MIPETLGDLPPLILRIYAVLFGLVWGSFLNVVIYRVPREMSVVRPPSHCPGCGKPVRIRDNLPVFGYLLLRGRARCCGAKLSPRYPLVEAIGGVLSLAILEVLVLRLGPETSLARAGAIYVADLALVLGLVAGAFIDLEHMYLPDTITIGGAILGLATSSLRGLSFTQSLIGAAVGFTTVWLPFVVIYPLVRGKVGMGLGDAKLLMLAGAWFGWPGALFVFGAGAVQGTIAAVITLLSRGKIEEPEAVKQEREEIQRELEQMTPEERALAEKELAEDPLAEEAGEGLGQARMAFGPFLVLATIEALFIGRDAIAEYFTWTDVL
ncbi:Leader peptidase (Prepilin peptidase) [Minicystis rosea]|nr:Leader peptidase (Prepilin peptidase) [Minicystis rosea]